MTVSISSIFSLFLPLWLKKNDLVSVTGLSSVKYQLEKAVHTIVFEVTIEWKKLPLSWGTTLDLLISFVRKQMFLLWFWKYLRNKM